MYIRENFGYFVDETIENKGGESKPFIHVVKNNFLPSIKNAYNKNITALTFFLIYPFIQKSDGFLMAIIVQ